MMMDTCSTNGKLEDGDSARSSTPATTVSSTASCVQVITELRNNDVMMGRGAGMIHNMGNVRFRELVATRKEEYVRAERNHKKQAIAKQILAEIVRRNGRFVRKVEKPEEAKALGIPEGTQAWVLANSDAVLEKVKQALRDKGPNDPDDCQPTVPEDKAVERVISTPSDAGTPPSAQNGAAALALQNTSTMSAFHPIDLARAIRQLEEEHKRQILLNQLQVRQHSLNLLRLGQLYQSSPPIVLDPSLYTLAQLSPAQSASAWRLSALNSALASTLGASQGGTLLNAPTQQQPLNVLPASLMNDNLQVLSALHPRQDAFHSAMAPRPPVGAVPTMSRNETQSEGNRSKKRKL
jgi:hypothetical protein